MVAQPDKVKTTKIHTNFENIGFNMKYQLLYNLKTLSTKCVDVDILYKNELNNVSNCIESVRNRKIGFIIISAIN